MLVQMFIIKKAPCPLCHVATKAHLTCGRLLGVSRGLGGRL